MISKLFSHALFSKRRVPRGHWWQHNRTNMPALKHRLRYEKETIYMV